jgi:Cysteine-rich CPCC
MNVACPCCSFLTMPGDDSFPGSFVICPVCFWEDDWAQLNDMDLAGGANRVSLRQARMNFRSFGAVDEQALAHVRPPREDEVPSAVSGA